MKFSRIASLCLIVAIACKQPATDETTASDSSLYETDTLAAAYDDDEAMREIIDYYGSIDTDIELALATYTPLDQVLTTARKAIYFKDSIEMARQTIDLTDPEDSALFMPNINKAYEAILSYQQAMKSGIKVNDQAPKLIDILRTPGASDKTSEILPTADNSNYLSHGNFFFMGGAPFIQKLEGTFEALDGSAEVRFGTSETENANYLFNSIAHQFGGASFVTFGPELDSYESGPQDIKGIGSLIHSFIDRIPVYFITEQGPLKGNLISVRVKLVPESLGCISDEPYYTFAYGDGDLDANDILGIYIPYNNTSADQLKVDRLNRAVWMADVNADGIADFACVSGYFEGISSDMMSEVLWFANIGGEWRIIDAGAAADCT
ncbi:MAG TPA: hypothetical protein VFE50_01705 [Cyclobacteriaceae bacterium]|nr:hypothetical protein [Cyclobacteriaceae bacterium]